MSHDNGTFELPSPRTRTGEVANGRTLDGPAGDTKSGEGNLDALRATFLIKIKSVYNCSIFRPRRENF